jgi:hypothetical protein
MRAVPLAQGTTDIEFRYWPEGMTAALAVSLTAVFCAMIWAVLSLAPRRARRGYRVRAHS